MNEVVIVIPDDSATGGVARSAVNLYGALLRLGYSAEIRCLKLVDPGYASQYEFVQRLAPGRPSKVRFWLGVVGSLRKLLRRKHAAAFIALGHAPSVILATISVGVRPRVMIGGERIHPPMERARFNFGLLRWLFYRRLDFIVCQTEASVEWFIRALCIHERKLVVIPNIVLPAPDPQQFASSDLPLVNIQGDSPLIICVGRLTAQKGLDYALEILASIKRALPAVRMAIAGVGPLENDLRTLARSLGICDEVSFLGRVESLSPLYFRADLMLFTSRYEGFPNALAEAMAHGVPAIAFDCMTGPADLITHGTNGYLVPLGDVAGAARLSIDLLQHGCKRRKLGREARKVAITYSADAIGSKWAALIARVGPSG